ncbi:hypothetical protein B0H19DRAFT_1244143 [Mycena capillaripes]|nr:hypothetical protein B0H19DRAFT_1244143 [Mycena capillaripes]
MSTPSRRSAFSYVTSTSSGFQCKRNGSTFSTANLCFLHLPSSVSSRGSVPMLFVAIFQRCVFSSALNAGSLPPPAPRRARRPCAPQIRAAFARTSPPARTYACARARLSPPPLSRCPRTPPTPTFTSTTVPPTPAPTSTTPPFRAAQPPLVGVRGDDAASLAHLHVEDAAPSLASTSTTPPSPPRLRSHRRRRLADVYVDDAAPAPALASTTLRRCPSPLPTPCLPVSTSTTPPRLAPVHEGKRSCTLFPRCFHSELGLPTDLANIPYVCALRLKFSKHELCSGSIFAACKHTSHLASATRSPCATSLPFYLCFEIDLFYWAPEG